MNTGNTERSQGQRYAPELDFINCPSRGVGGQQLLVLLLRLEFSLNVN